MKATSFTQSLSETIVPFGMVSVDLTTPQERGYEIINTHVTYNPKKQISNLFWMGKSTPTTYSMTSGWKGEDNDADDEGSD